MKSTKKALDLSSAVIVEEEGVFCLQIPGEADLSLPVEIAQGIQEALKFEEQRSEVGGGVVGMNCFKTVLKVFGDYTENDIFDELKCCDRALVLRGELVRLGYIRKLHEHIRSKLNEVGVLQIQSLKTIREDKGGRFRAWLWGTDDNTVDKSTEHIIFHAAIVLGQVREQIVLFQMPRMNTAENYYHRMEFVTLRDVYNSGDYSHSKDGVMVATISEATKLLESKS